jgi:hypothetical protein
MRGFSKDLGNRVVKRCISISPREMRRSLTLRGQGNLKGTRFTTGKNSEGENPMSVKGMK